MRKRTPRRSSGGKERPQKASEDNRRRDPSGRATLRAAMPFPVPSSAAADADAATTSDILAGIRRRKAGRKRRRGVPAAAAGVVVLFSALCAALLWVGVGSFSPKQAAAGAGSTSTRGRGSSEVCFCVRPCSAREKRWCCAWTRAGSPSHRNIVTCLALSVPGGGPQVSW